MSTQRICDCCGEPFTPWTKRIMTQLFDRNERHIGRVTIDVLSATGKEDICRTCVRRTVVAELSDVS